MQVIEQEKRAHLDSFFLFSLFSAGTVLVSFFIYLVKNHKRQYEIQQDKQKGKKGVAVQIDWNFIFEKNDRKATCKNTR